MMDGLGATWRMKLSPSSPYPGPGSADFVLVSSPGLRPESRQLKKQAAGAPAPSHPYYFFSILLCILLYIAPIIDSKVGKCVHHGCSYTSRESTTDRSSGGVQMHAASMQFPFESIVWYNKIPKITTTLGATSFLSYCSILSSPRLLHFSLRSIVYTIPACSRCRLLSPVSPLTLLARS